MSVRETERGLDVAVRAQTDMQRRLEQALSEHAEVRMSVRNGGPDDLPEVERELTMCSGAIHGVQQRVADLAARLMPVMPGDGLTRLLKDIEPGSSLEPDTQTEVGQRLRSLQRQMSEIETVLSHLIALVRL